MNGIRSKYELQAGTVKNHDCEPYQWLWSSNSGKSSLSQNGVLVG